MGARSLALRGRLALFAVVAGALLVLPGGALAQSGGCANETVREEQNVVYLPDCRAYEMVSPLDKNGADVVGRGRTMFASVDGERIAYAGLAGFGQTSGSGAAGWTQYLAAREPGGWASHGITPTPARGAFQFLIGYTLLNGFSDDLSHALTEGYDLPGATGAIPKAINYYREDTLRGGLETITTPLGSESFEGNPQAVWESPRAFSSDLGVVTLQTSANLLPETSGFEQKLYAWEHGTLKVAGRLPDESIPPGGAGAAIPGNFTAFENRVEHSVSADGSHIVFTAPLEGPGEPQLYMRRDGAKTVWVSEPESPSAPSEAHKVTFEGATPDGKHVFFVTSDALLEADPGGPGTGLYEYTDSPSPESESNLTFIARIDGSINEPQRDVTGYSDDGQRVYFYTEANASFPEGGMYLWDQGALHFVAAVGNAVRRLPGVLVKQQAEVSSDGQRLAFVTDEQLTGQPVGFGSESRLYAMYLYDEASESLRCVSCMPTAPTSANVTVEPEATETIAGAIFPLQPRFLSSDGHYVLFATADPLVAADTNGLSDVYEYNADTGEVRMLSPGTGEDGAWFSAASADGRNVFIVTRQPLVRSDTDTLLDLYDVRVGGGFPQPPPQIGGCVGDECQGVPSAAPTFNTASGFSGLGNPVAAKGGTAKRGKHLTRAQKLTRALRACTHRPKSRRARCRKLARQRYGAKKAKTSVSRQGRR